MKRVAWLSAVVCVAGLMLGCDKGSEKPLDVKNITATEIPGAPNLALDGAGGTGVQKLDLSMVRSSTELKAEYNAQVDLIKDAARAAAAKNKTTSGAGAAGAPAGGAADTAAPVAAADTTEAGLIGVWKATKVEPKPDQQAMADAFMSMGIEFKADHTFTGLKNGAPVADPDANGTWTLKDGTVTLSVKDAPPMGFTGKTVTMPGPTQGMTITMEKP